MAVELVDSMFWIFFFMVDRRTLSGYQMDLLLFWILDSLLRFRLPLHGRNHDKVIDLTGGN